MKRVIVKQRVGWLEEAASQFRRQRERMPLAVGDLQPYNPEIYNVGAVPRTDGSKRQDDPKQSRALEAADVVRDADGLDSAGTLYDLGVCLRQTGQFAKAESHFRRAAEIFEAHLGPENLEVGVTLHALGVCWRDAGRLVDAESHLRRALKIFQARLGRDHPHVTVTLYELGLCERSAGRLREAESHLFQALDILELKRERDDLHVAETLHALALCARQSGRPGEAEFHLVGALEIKESKLGPSHHQVAVTLHELGVCALVCGRLAEADFQLRRALDIFEATLGQDGVHVAGALHSLGLCARQAGRLVEAEIHFRRALKILEAKPGPESLQVAMTWHEMGLCVRQAGRRREAEGYLRRALEITQEAKAGSGDLQEGATLHELGVSMRETGRLLEAESFLRRALLISEGGAGSNSLDLASTLYELGVCLQAAGRPTEAEYLVRRAHNILEARLGYEDSEVAETLREIGLCMEQAGRPRTDALLQQAQNLQDTALASIELGHGTEAVQPGIGSREHHRGGRPSHSKAYSSGALLNKEGGLEPSLKRSQVTTTLRQLGDASVGVKQEKIAEEPVNLDLKRRDARDTSDDERFGLNRPVRKDRSRELRRGTTLAATKKWKSARSVFEGTGLELDRQKLVESKSGVRSGAPARDGVPKDANGDATAVVAEADGGAGLPLNLASRSALLPAPKGPVRTRHRGHHKSTSVHVDVKTGAAIRMPFKFTRESSGSRGGSLFLHLIGEILAAPAPASRSSERPARVKLLSPNEVSPLVGPNVLFHRWRDEYGRVELRIAPGEARHVRSARLLDRVYMEDIPRSGETGPCLIGPVIDGPGHARFTPGTATVSFYLGRCDDFVLPDNREAGKKELEGHALHTYFPVKGDGINQRWQSDGDFKVAWKGDELWLQAALLHFCKRGVAKKIGEGWGVRLPRLRSRRGATAHPLSFSPPPQPRDPAVEAGLLPVPPLGSAKYPAGWAQVDNCTQVSLEVLVVPESPWASDALKRSRGAQPAGEASEPRSARDASGARVHGSSKGPIMASLGSRLLQGVGPDESRGVLLPGEMQGRLLWCSVTAALTPEDLPYGKSPNAVSEAQLNGLGYTVGGGIILKRCFVESRSGRSHRSLLLVRVWDCATVAPLSYHRILPKRLTQPCLWEAAVPSRADVAAKLGEYISLAPAPSH